MTGDEVRLELELRDGRVTLFAAESTRDGALTGTYTVFRDRFTFESDTDPDTFTANSSFADGTLRFSKLTGPESCGFALTWTTHPWTLVE